VPLTRDAALFEQARSAGARLLWLHTYGERYRDSGTGAPAGGIQKDTGQGASATGISGTARNTKPVPGGPEGYPESFSHDGNTLHVGAGEFAPVSSAVFNFEVSGLKVVQSWLGYRMKAGKGKKSSPLDDIRPEKWTAQFTTELLELLWVLAATLESYPKQAAILDWVLAGPLFRADELPAVPAEMRKPPKQAKSGALFDDEVTDGD
jgi:Type ISP C-terminal specificity domain